MQVKGERRALFLMGRCTGELSAFPDAEHTLFAVLCDATRRPPPKPTRSFASPRPRPTPRADSLASPLGSAQAVPLTWGTIIMSHAVLWDPAWGSRRILALCG